MKSTVADRTIEGTALAMRRSLSRRQIADTIARGVVSAGGMATILSIVGILGFIFVETYPLWKKPFAETESSFAIAAGPVLAPAIDEYRGAMDFVTAQGVVRVVRLADGTPVKELPIPALNGRAITAMARAGKDHVLVATDDGRLVAVRVRLDSGRESGQRVLQPRVTETGSWSLAVDGGAVRLLAASVPDDSGVTVVYAPSTGAPQLYAVSETENVLGERQRTETRRELPLPNGGTATALAVAADGRRAYVGTSNGFVYYWDLSDRSAPQLVDGIEVTAQRSIGVTMLGFLIGDRALVVGDATGNVSVWFPVRDPSRPEGWHLQKVHVLEPHDGPVTAFAPSPRDKTFLTGAATGQVRLHHSTTARTLLDLPRAGSAVAALAFAPKADGGLSIDTTGRVTSWKSVNPHPEVSLQALFGKVWYEGYPEPEYVWQSTGGTDDFEPKLSLVPLIIGTLKGTLYALLFAVPMAVLGAIYTSQFVHPRVRDVIKPTVEIMAALPSVVLGFLAGLWLAPLIEDIMPAVLGMLVVIPALMFVAGMFWGTLPTAMRSRLQPGMEVVVLIPLIIVGVQLCLWANAPLERLFFGGNFHRWLMETAGWRYDQRNCIVVGFAMGFAVIPIIFTISDDALSNVPQRLTSGSLALGATRWQTAMRVVFPTASPGIFSAIMVGFGRAVGETMIVLMATGNTPVLDWSIFTGMRTLSANIAVEIPEAPQGSTLYRVLFLAALLLFVLTFILNTGAELVRIRLRRRYQQL